MNRSELAQTLEDRASTLGTLPVVTGFDGFVDEMISVVDERHSLDQYRRVETIADLGNQISAAAGHSSLREIILNQIDPGGCAINMGDGLATLGLPVTTFATVGEPFHPAFADYGTKAQLVSWGSEPGRTLAFEFADGKLMFSAVSQLQKFHPDALAEYLRDGQFRKSCEQAHLIAITDWTLYPHMTLCWKYLRENVFSHLKSPRFFFDLVDPTTRSESDIRAMLSELSRYEEHGEVTLGLNQNEANILSQLTGSSHPKATDPTTATSQAASLRKALGLHTVIIHSIRYAVGASAKESTEVWGPYCENPKKSTGAGDRFNAGYALGKVLERPLRDALQLAVASSGFFVRHGHSATSDDLCQFLRDWDTA
ncbi:PfkB family carbohydrate kinase [Puniceicoccus vermicola]|uniref:Carbohydrate kinase family protein n=1 Tax=Puniceicoccus vermicola TaxID=388746 RepID=A0A7X1E5N8_9BACT|nr:carbohydrate kinase family protein [Puniceicoccus vermicola]MBC2603845.1 carbohydrate kinase family protein [Puniceicoccus vermicola]